jgi:hypothetical protein
VVNVGAPEMLVLLLIFVGTILPLWGIIDAALRPDDVWARANQNKLVWILLQIFLGPLGAVAYFAAIRPKLKAAAAAPSAV